MRPHRSKIAGMMAVVALAAVDCLGVRMAEFVAGCWLIGAAMQVGLFAMFRSRGNGRRFWAGFEASGFVLMIGYTAASQTGRDLYSARPWLRHSRPATNLLPFVVPRKDGDSDRVTTQGGTPWLGFACS